MVMVDPGEKLQTLISQLEDKILPLRHQYKKLFLQVIRKQVKKHRKDCLISKSAGLGGTSVGAVLALVGFPLLAPFTFGVSSPLIIAGCGLFIGGDIVTTSTRIAEPVFAKKLKNRLKKLNPRLERSLILGLKQCSKIRNYHIYLLWKNRNKTEHDKYDNTELWLRLRLFKDHRVEASDLKSGDNIYRRGNLSGSALTKVFYHHGVCVDFEDGKGLKVIDFGLDSKPTVHDLSEWIFNDKILYRRDYMGWDVPHFDFLKNVKAVLEFGFWEYNLWTNNCEHFATYLKLGMNGLMSQQQKKTESILLKSSGSLFFGVGVAIGIPFGKFVFPIVPIYDACRLHEDFKTRDKNLELVALAVKSLEDSIELLNHYLKVLREHQQGKKGLIEKPVLGI